MITDTTGWTMLYSLYKYPSLEDKYVKMTYSYAVIQISEIIFIYDKLLFHSFFNI